jgi:hypothetical protein
MMVRRLPRACRRVQVRCSRRWADQAIAVASGGRPAWRSVSVFRHGGRGGRAKRPRPAAGDGECRLVAAPAARPALLLLLVAGSEQKPERLPAWPMTWPVVRGCGSLAGSGRFAVLGGVIDATECRSTRSRRSRAAAWLSREQSSAGSLPRRPDVAWAGETRDGRPGLTDARARGRVQVIVIWVRRIIERRPWRLCRVSV